MRYAHDMALPNHYAGQACSLARSLEIIGERWTLLIVRDAFFGVRRFADFIDHLRVPRAVLASRLKTLTAAGVMTRVAGERYLEYQLTEKGAALWPVVLSLMSWGDDFCAPDGPRRLFRHAADDGHVDQWGHCDRCGRPVPAADIIVAPGPGLEPPADDDGWVTDALTSPHRLLEPLRPAAAPA
jgi:DNA-binding HxlR family transcriptional regulator